MELWRFPRCRASEEDGKGFVTTRAAGSMGERRTMSYEITMGTDLGI
jgi:hypothetical protein